MVQSRKESLYSLGLRKRSSSGNRLLKYVLLKIVSSLKTVVTGQVCAHPECIYYCLLFFFHWSNYHQAQNPLSAPLPNAELQNINGFTIALGPMPDFQFK